MSDTLAFLRQMHAADRLVLDAVERAIPDLARAVDAIAARLDAGGHLYYCGAGTSGRLGVLDASELPPTFGTSPSLVRALLAGGREAMFESREGAEDDAAAGAADLQQIGLLKYDAVVGIAASGATPYVIGAFEYARALGCLTVSIVCIQNAPISHLAEIAVVADTGPEFLAGSTRLKAGTAQKLLINMLSTAVMGKRGLVYKGEMVAMRPTNAKLRKRAERIVGDILQIAPERAKGLLEAASWDLPAALVSGKHQISAAAARERIRACGGNVAKAIDG
ncbi:MAG: N-acetylmuramic acid 6-phosphate etherase [Planctomycetes bacterium]|nr:N-acetylmuramic acid 6-phosphate etherase [Planctomycetota bacterium]